MTWHQSLRTVSQHLPVALLSLLSALLAVPSCADTPGSTAAFQAAIRQKYDMKEAAFAANDPTPILERFYHPDVVSVGPDGHVLSGRDALRPVYLEVIASDVRIESYRSFVNGDAGWDWVNFHVTPPRGLRGGTIHLQNAVPVVAGGRRVVVTRRDVPTGRI